MRDPGHADHARFGQALDKLQALEQQRAQAGLKPLFANPQEAERAAGQLAYESKVSGMRQIDHVVARPDGTGLFAVQGELGIRRRSGPSSTASRRYRTRSRPAAGRARRWTASSIRVRRNSSRNRCATAGCKPCASLGPVDRSQGHPPPFSRSV